MKVYDMSTGKVVINIPEATVTEIMHLLDMKASDFMREWKELPDSYKLWYKQQATKELALINK